MSANSSTLDMVLSLTGGQVLIPLKRACEIAGLAIKTWRNREYAGKPIPFPATQGIRRVDVRDLAAYLDSIRPAGVSEPTLLAPILPSPLTRRPGRPRKAEQIALRKA